MKRAFGAADPLQDARRVQTAQMLVDSTPNMDIDLEQYVHISVARTITAQHTFAPASDAAPFVLGAHAQGQTVTGLKADQLNKSVNGKALTGDITLALASSDFLNQGTTTTVLHGNAAGNPAWGAIVENDITLSDNTTRNVTTSAHGLAPKAVAPAAGVLNYLGINNGETVSAWKSASSAPGAAASILATNASGQVTLAGLLTASAGASFGGDLTMTGDSDITLGTEIQILDHGAHGHIVVNTTVDEQFDINAGGNIRAGGYFVGKHAIQLPGALMICHYDGAQPYATNYTGDPTGHMGQVAAVAGGVIYRPGKFGKAIQLAEATTNLVLNPSAEGASQIIFYGTAARTTSDSEYGNYSAEIVANGVLQGVLFSTAALSAGTTYTLSFYLKTPVAFATGLSVNMYAISGGEDTYLASISTAYSDWTRLSYTFAPTQSSAYYVRFFTAGASGHAFVDGVQLEQKSYATPYCDGSLGDGHSWSGTAHASTSSRTAATLKYTNPLSATAGTISLWWSHANANTTAQAFPYVFSEGNLKAYFNATDDKIYFTDGTNIISTAAQTFSANAFLHLVFTWSSSGLAIYVNGVSAATGATYTAPTLGAYLFIGSDTTPANQCNGLIDDLAILDRAVSAAEDRAIFESNAPVFAETSTWAWRSANNLAWADSEGLWALDASGNAVLGVSGIASKSWGGATLDAGDILIGRAAASNNNILWDASAGTLSIRNNATERIGLSAAGILSIKDSGGNAVFTFDASTGAEFTKPLTIGTSGGIYQGSGTFAAPTTGLKIWNDSGVGRIAGYNTSVMQWWAATDGKLYAGGGNTVIEQAGMRLVSYGPAITFERYGTYQSGQIRTKYDSAVSDESIELIKFNSAGSQLVSDPGFDAGFATWTLTQIQGSTPVVEGAAAGGHFSPPCIHISVGGDSISPDQVSATSGYITCSASKVTELSAWVKTSLSGSGTGLVFYIRIDWYNSSNTLLGATSNYGSYLSAATQWRNVIVRDTSPATTAKCKITIFADGGIAGNLLTAYVDDLMMVQMDSYVSLKVAGGGVISDNLNIGAATGAPYGAIMLKEIAAPGAPGTDQGVLYMDVSGAKSRLMVRFQSGAVQQLAIEP